MIAKYLISDHIIPLKTSNTGAEALSSMDDYKLSHLPIVNNEELLGVLSEHDIYNFNDFTEPIGSHGLSLSNAYAMESDHVFDVIRSISDSKLSLLPVLDDNNHYRGCITLANLVDHISQMIAIQSPGGIIVLEMVLNDYSLSEIAQIVESNNTKVLGVYISNTPDTTRVDVTIKVNKVDISAILQTFIRYDYYIKASYSENPDIDDLKERYDSFMKYLNM